MERKICLRDDTIRESSVAGDGLLFHQGRGRRTPCKSQGRDILGKQGTTVSHRRLGVRHGVREDFNPPNLGGKGGSRGQSINGSKNRKGKEKKEEELRSKSQRKNVTGYFPSIYICESRSLYISQTGDHDQEGRILIGQKARAGKR